MAVTNEKGKEKTFNFSIRFDARIMTYDGSLGGMVLNCSKTNNKPLWKILNIKRIFEFVTK
jgi:hypothetical protein